MDEDDDDFLYGGSQSQPRSTSQPSVSQPAPIEQQPTSGLVSHLEKQVEDDADNQTTMEVEEDDSEENGIEMEEEDVESDEDDIEIIMEQPSRSLDLRHNAARTSIGRTTSTIQNTPAKPTGAQPSLTTEYTPISRGGAGPTGSLGTGPQFQAIPAPYSATTTPQPRALSQPAVQPQPITESQPQFQQEPQPTPQPATVDDDIDASTLSVVTAPPSHPAIDPTIPGTLNQQNILDFDLNALTEKPWRRPGSDISDWFNYGFDEVSWEAYCYRRRDVGDVAGVLKANVLNFSNLNEETVTSLPPEARQMVMAGTSAMMTNAANNPDMMRQAMMMEMPGMLGMAMGMNGEMGMGGPVMGVMGDGISVQGSVGPEQGMINDGFNGGMGMPMGSEYGMQEQNPMAAQMYQEPPVPIMPPRAPSNPTIRGRTIPQGPSMRTRGGYAGRGRATPTGPARPASPLPPGVPTGPRNQNKYKDRDGNAAAVEGLDYGNKEQRTSSGEPEERSSSRKRRGSQGGDDGRSTKRR